MGSRKSALFGLILFLSSGSAQASLQSGPGQSDALLEDGIKLLGGGRFLEAVAAFNNFKQTAPGDPRPYFYSGIALSEAGRLSAAALELSEAVRMGPERPEYRVFQANVLSRLRQTAGAVDALTIFDRRVVQQQLDTAWLWLLSDVYLRLERHEQALDTLKSLRKRSPADARIDLNAGKVYLEKGELDLAADCFKKSIAKSPDNPAAYFELGKILHMSNELEAAKKAFLEAVRQDAQNPECLLRLGLVCLALGQDEEALGYLKRAEPAGSSHPRIYYALGNAYQAVGNRGKAVEYRKRFQEISLAERRREDVEREAARLIKEGENQLDQGHAAEARALFEKVLRSDPDNWDAHGYLAEAFLSSGELQLAYDHLVVMDRLDPDSVVGNYLMAKHWYERREYDKARAYAEKVKSFRPSHAELRNLLGHIYLRLDQQEKALREYEAAILLAPGRSDFREDLLRIKNRQPER